MFGKGIRHSFTKLEDTKIGRKLAFLCLPCWLGEKQRCFDEGAVKGQSPCRWFVQKSQFYGILERLLVKGEELLLGSVSTRNSTGAILLHMWAYQWIYKVLFVRGASVLLWASEVAPTH